MNDDGQEPPQPAHDIEREEHPASSGKNTGYLETVVFQAQAFSGPVPSPMLLEEYEKILPGSAERMFQMAEQEMVHRQQLEVAVVTANIKKENRGQWLAFSIAMTALLGGIALMVLGRSIEGAATALSAVASLVGTFLWAQHQKKQTLRHPPETETDPSVP